MIKTIHPDVIPELVEHLLSDREYSPNENIDATTVAGVFWEAEEYCAREVSPALMKAVGLVLTAALEAFNERVVDEQVVANIEIENRRIKSEER